MYALSCFAISDDLGQRVEDGDQELRSEICDGSFCEEGKERRRGGEGEEEGYYIYVVQCIVYSIQFKLIDKHTYAMIIIKMICHTTCTLHTEHTEKTHPTHSLSPSLSSSLAMEVSSTELERRMWMERKQNNTSWKIAVLKETEISLSMVGRSRSERYCWCWMVGMCEKFLI